LTHTFTKQDYLELIRLLGQEFQDQKDYLSKLDTGIGDGDHGFSMAKGFGSLAVFADRNPDLPLDKLLQKGGFEIIKSVGGAAGAVFGTLFLGQAACCREQLSSREELKLQDLSEMHVEALAQIQKRGGAVPGDKTMVDALAPAAAALQSAVEAGCGLAEGFSRAAEAAEKGAESTRDLIGKKGRSKNLGERGRGFIDPGAVSTALYFRVFADYLHSQSDQDESS
jgi:dihydroxyacetone kinase-like protein